MNEENPFNESDPLVVSKPANRAGYRANGDLRGKISYLPDIHRLLPQSPDAERGVLCSLLLNPREVASLCIERRVTGDSFHIPSHATIYRQIMALIEARQPSDFIKLTQALRDSGRLDEIGGASYVTDLFAFIPTAANASYYIEILLEKETLRQVITTCTEYAARSYDEQDNVPCLIDELETKVLAIRPQDTGTQISTKELVMQAVEAIEHAYERRGTVSGLATGFHSLDLLIDGLRPGNYFVVAARPSVGKTAFGMGIVEHAAVDLRKAVGVFSLEMSQTELMQRLLCSRARVNMHRIRSGFLADNDFPNLTTAASKIASSRIIMDDAPATSIQRARAVARRWKSEYGVELIIADYLQLFTSDTQRARQKREQEVSEVSAGFKQMARELGIPVVVLAQVNRDSAKEKRAPRIYDLRDSGSIEQDADVIGLLDRPEMRAENDKDRAELEGQATLEIAKQRSGAVGEIALTFLKEFTRFEDRAQQELPI